MPAGGVLKHPKPPKATAPMPGVGQEIKVLLGSDPKPRAARVLSVFPSGAIGILAGDETYMIPLWRVVKEGS